MNIEIELSHTINAKLNQLKSIVLIMGGWPKEKPKRLIMNSIKLTNFTS